MERGENEGALPEGKWGRFLWSIMGQKCSPFKGHVSILSCPYAENFKIGR